MGITEDLVLKFLGGAGGLGVVVYLVMAGMKAFGGHLDKERAAQADERKLFAGTLEKVGADMKSGLVEVKSGMDSLRAAMVDIDKSHTQQNRETFLQLINLNDKQNIAIGTVVQKVDHLDERVGQLAHTMGSLADTIGDHGVVLDNISRSIPGLAARRLVGQIEEKSAQ